MKALRFLSSALIGAALLALSASAPAQGVVKLGMVGEFSGPFAQYGQQILGGSWSPATTSTS